MPSTAYNLFKDNVIDVERLIESHGQLNNGARGKKGLGHLTRSGIVMLCAAWEVYVEDLLEHVVQRYGECLELPDQLPKAVQRHLSTSVKNDKHELKPIQFAGAGWRTVYLEYAQRETQSLNSPTPGNLNELYLRYAGVPELSSCWTVDAGDISEFVHIRGKIAHTGRKSKYVKIGDLQDYLEEFKRVAIETDNFMAEFVRDNTPDTKFPWYRIMAS